MFDAHVAFHSFCFVLLYSLAKQFYVENTKTFNFHMWLLEGEMIWKGFGVKLSPQIIIQKDDLSKLKLFPVN